MRGLPDTNGDHAINALSFLPDRRLVIHIGAATNGGIFIATDGLGRIKPSFFSGAIVTCPISGIANIKYADFSNPSLAVTSNGRCEIYAAGFRYTFSGTVNKNGGYYATSNEPNLGFVNSKLIAMVVKCQQSICQTVCSKLKKVNVIDMPI